MGVVEIAKEYIGKVTYKFGANDLENGFADCSSFTQSVFKKAGINIGRDTNRQWQEGDPVSRDGLIAGDLVFFHSTYQNDHKDGVSHVGIYVSDDNFIHCSSSKGVTVSNLNSKYYSEHYLGARRHDGAYSEGVSVSEGLTSSEGVSVSEGLNLTWWGDIVVVVLATLLVVGGVGMLALGVKSTVFK